jgi:hypothetical protein
VLIEACLDAIFDTVDTALSAGRFQEVNLAIESVNVSEWPSDLLAGLLSITAAASHELPSRAAFFKRVRCRLSERGEDTDTLLRGLEGGGA